MLILTQFLLRLSFGMAVSMGLVSSRQVTSGYFRNNLYVMLGMGALTGLVAWTAAPEAGLYIWPPVVLAAVSYAAAVAWLYESPRLGKLLLWIAAAAAIAGCWLDAQAQWTVSGAAAWLWGFDPVGEGLVLGATMAAMLLGHWYLNAPGMRLEPLKQLIALIGLAVLLRAAACAAGLGLELVAAGESHDARWWLLVTLRWLAGLVGTIVIARMAWKTLEIPNTQSATGILYVGVIGTFLGELTAQLLSREALYPL